MNPDASFCKKIEKGMHNRHLKAIGPKPTSWQFSTFKVSFSTPKVSFDTPNVPNWPYGSECTLVFECRLDPSSRFFWLVLVPRHVFTHIQRFFISFLDNSGLFRNNYLVDKYPKINLNKVQIIHNFIVIQLSLLFLCKQSYFRH